MLLSLLLSMAYADSLTLDSGAVLQGQLAVYQYGGDCQISVSEGVLRGSIVIVPCAKIARMERSAPDPAAVAGAQPEAPAPAAALPTEAAPAAPSDPAPSDPAPAPPTDTVASTDAAAPSAAPTAAEAPPADGPPADAASADAPPASDALPDTFAAQIPGPEIAEAPAEAPAPELSGVQMDAAVTVDPGLLPDGRPAARAPSVQRPPTGRPSEPPLAIPPNPDGTAKMGW